MITCLNVEVVSSQANVIMEYDCRRQLHPRLNSSLINNSSDQQSTIAGKAGGDIGPLHSIAERQGESRVISEEIMPPSTSVSSPKSKPQVAHAFTLAHSLLLGGG